MFKPTKAKSVKEYIALINQPRRADIQALDKLIRKTVPKWKPKLWGSIIGYGSYHYKYASGREGDWMLIGLASQKNYISLYVCAVMDGKYIAEKYKKELPKASIGRSCIRFKKLTDIDQKVLVKILKEATKSQPQM